MPDTQGFATEAELDRISAERRGGSIPDKPLSAEEREKRRQDAADRRNQAALDEPDRKVGVKRLDVARKALLSGVQSGMRHGVSVSDREKKRITAGIIAELGGEVTDEVAAGIRRFVDVAATSYRDGNPGPAWELAREAAAAIANADFDLEYTPDEADDPGVLATRIFGPPR